LVIKILQNGLHPAAVLRLPELRPPQPGVEVDLREICLPLGAEEDIKDGIRELPPSHGPPAERENLLVYIDGTKGPPLEEVFPESLGIIALVGLGVLPHYHHPKVPSPGQEGLDYQGKGKGLEAGQTMESFETRPDAHSHSQVGPIPFGHHRPRQAGISQPGG
jgi:hypothetical protein